MGQACVTGRKRPAGRAACCGEMGETGKKRRGKVPMRSDAFRWSEPVTVHGAGQRPAPMPRIVVLALLLAGASTAAAQAVPPLPPLPPPVAPPPPATPPPAVPPAPAP